MRVQNYYSYLIDNILVNNPDQVSISRNIISDISDHFSQFFFLYFKSGNEKALPIKTKMRDFSHSFVSHDKDIKAWFPYNRNCRKQCGSDWNATIYQENMRGQRGTLGALVVIFHRH